MRNGAALRQEEPARRHASADSAAAATRDGRVAHALLAVSAVHMLTQPLPLRHSCVTAALLCLAEAARSYLDPAGPTLATVAAGCSSRPSHRSSQRSRWGARMAPTELEAPVAAAHLISIEIVVKGLLWPRFHRQYPECARRSRTLRCDRTRRCRLRTLALVQRLRTPPELALRRVAGWVDPGHFQRAKRTACCGAKQSHNFGVSSRACQGFVWSELVACLTLHVSMCFTRLRFGKTGEDEFTLLCGSPLSTLQGFAVACSSLTK